MEEKNNKNKSKNQYKILNPKTDIVFQMLFSSANEEVQKV